jgi:hypothetical protein
LRDFIVINTVIFFEVEARSEEQQADAGWYYEAETDGVSAEPVGPFATICAARRSYHTDMVAVAEAA